MSAERPEEDKLWEFLFPYIAGEDVVYGESEMETLCEDVLPQVWDSIRQERSDAAALRERMNVRPEAGIVTLEEAIVDLQNRLADRFQTEKKLEERIRLLERWIAFDVWTASNNAAFQGKTGPDDWMDNLPSGQYDMWEQQTLLEKQRILSIDLNVLTPESPAAASEEAR